MNRRDVLEKAGSAGLVCVSAAGGCLSAPGSGDATGTGDATVTDDENESGCAAEDEGGSSDDDPEIEGSEWRHDVGGWVEAVSHGRVFGREDFADEGADGGIFALDVETGDREWTYGETGGYHSYTTLTVRDAVYFGLGDDAVGSGSGEVYALEYDGAERWTRGTGSVYSRPRVVDGFVYAGSDDGVVRAFDTDDGEVRWRTDVGGDDVSPDVTVADAADAVYVATGRLLALDPDDGGVLWSYGDADDRIRDATVVDGVAYLSTRDGIVAVADGEERWSVDFESNRWIKRVDADRVFVEHRYDLHALDVATGEERWILEDVERMSLDVHGDGVYVGGDRLRALDAADGSEIWSESVWNGDPVRSVTVVDEAGGVGDHSVFFHDGDTTLARVNPSGEERWRETVDGRIRNYLVDRFVFVGSRAGVYSLDPW